MEKVTLQLRIEERAKQRLWDDLVAASDKEKEIAQLFGSDLYKPQIDAWWYHSTYSRSKDIRLGNEYTKKLFDDKLPVYIEIVTDELLRKIDEIDYLLQNQNEPADCWTLSP
jgi:hypothetical protein